MGMRAHRSPAWLAARRIGGLLLPLRLRPDSPARAPTAGTAAAPSLLFCAPKLAAAGRLAASTPVVLFYGGTHDWMNANFGDDLADALTRGGLLRAASHRLRDSGHHCYLEACDEFNAVLLGELKAVR